MHMFEIRDLWRKYAKKKSDSWKKHEKKILSWSKSSRNSFRKFKIQVLFIKSDIVPFKVLPIDYAYASTWSSSRNISFSIVDVAIRTVFDFSITSFRLLKRIPRNDFLTRSNRKKLVSQYLQGFHTIESIFNAKFNTNSLLPIQFHF